jgi:hypothetical protein
LIFSQNNVPVATSTLKYAFTAIATNIELDVTDADGNNLSYTLINSPSNGTATITDGVLTYTSANGFTGSDTISFKANDGFVDSNEAQVQINVVEQESNLNWGTNYSTSQLAAAERDGLGNTYTVGTFWIYSNFKDYTTLDASYPQGGRDGYIAKYNSNGALEWASTFGGTYDDGAYDVAVASDGNIIVLASFRGGATFADGSSLGDTSNDNWNTIVLKLNPNDGSIIWKKEIPQEDLWAQNNGLVLESNNNIIIVSQNFGWRISNHLAFEFYKLDYSSGNILISDKTLSGAQSFGDMIVDSQGNIIITGSFYGNVDIDFNDSSEFILTGGSQRSIYFAKFDSDFNLIWETSFGGTESAPISEMVTYYFNKRPNKGKIKMPKVKFTWYDGGHKPERPKGMKPGMYLGNWDGGAIFHGTKGTLVCGTYAMNPIIIGREDNPPAVTNELRRIETSHEMDWIRACKENKNSRVEASSNFSYSGPLNEVVVMGNLAIRLQDLRRRF